MAKARTYRNSTKVERPPAYQEYAAAELGAEAVRLMSPAERGLYWSMRCYVWINDSVPTDPAWMARVLGFTETEVIENLTPRVLAHFESADDDPTRLICPALVRQMEKLMQRREAQAQGGRDAAQTRREKAAKAAKARRENGKQALSTLPSTHVATYPSLEKSKEQHSKDQKALLEGKTVTSSPPVRGNGHG